jgi:hypothetical protein
MHNRPIMYNIINTSNADGAPAATHDAGGASESPSPPAAATLRPSSARQTSGFVEHLQLQVDRGRPPAGCTRALLSASCTCACKAIVLLLLRVRVSSESRVLDHDPSTGSESLECCASSWPGRWPGTRFRVRLSSESESLGLDASRCPVPAIGPGMMATFFYFSDFFRLFPKT